MEESADISRFLALRRATRAVSDYLAQQLNGHLSALTPLFSPRVVFGDRIRGGAKLTGRDAEKAYADLTGLYEGIYRAKPFNLRRDFDSPIELLSATPEITSSSYSYSAERAARMPAK